MQLANIDISGDNTQAQRTVDSVSEAAKIFTRNLIASSNDVWSIGIFEYNFWISNTRSSYIAQKAVEYGMKHESECALVIKASFRY